MKICLIKTSSMGDVIHTLPALTDAQSHLPNLQVDWVIEPAFAEIPHWHPTVSRVIPAPFRQWRKKLFQIQTWQEWQKYKATLQLSQYDAVIDAQGLIKSAFLATRLANGPKYGYSYTSAREGVSSFFYDHRYTVSYQKHAVTRIRELFANTLSYPLPDNLGDYGISTKLANVPPEPTAYLIAIHATTRADKHWPEEYWQTLFQYFTQRNIEVRLPWGNEYEYQRAMRFSHLSPLIKVLPRLTLTELAHQIIAASMVISVDTGLSHLTAALNVPNIILYGATDPKLIGAYGYNQHYLTDNGMEKILPEQVIAQFEAIRG